MPSSDASWSKSARANIPAPAVMADTPPAPVPAPVPVPGKGMGKAEAEELDSADEVLRGGAGVNESAISGLALGAEEDIGGRNASTNVLAGLEQEGADGDERTQRLSEGAGASSSSERGTHKARSRKSAKSDPKDREKKTKKKREVRGEEAAKLKRAAMGRVEWLERLAPLEPEREDPAPATASAPEPTVAADPAPALAEGTLAVVDSKPNPRSSGFISVATLQRAPITLPAPESAPTAQSNPRRVVNRYQAPPQVEMKYDVKSARGGRGGRVTPVASIWAEATKARGGSALTQAAKATKATGNPAQPKAAAHKATRTLSRPRSRHQTTTDVSSSAAADPQPAPVSSKAEKEDAPPVAARVPRALFGPGVAAAATPSSPALSSSIATPVLSSTASLAQPPAIAAAASCGTPSPQPLPHPSQQSQPAVAAGWRALLVGGAGLKADLAFGQARLRDLIRRRRGQAA
ncbi:hypothetical protein EDB85DRAFT_2148702 [Lactarius pseudohatsudake]|nr:hypothetical protein EDB85DRAFT_2297625 [Lactarius pseudohatsudake]KAH9027154.1 hypothetical protein EDB85DRAFT_2148702 [Lactarius pseudohatsudake]